MMKLHKEVAGKKTRSLETWLENEKMILQNKGFLVCALFKDKIIFNPIYSEYLTLDGLRLIGNKIYDE